MNDKTASQRQILIEIAEGYVSAKMSLEALYPESLMRSIENCERYIAIMQAAEIETFEDIIDFWYINGEKEFEYDVFAPWWGRKEEKENR